MAFQPGTGGGRLLSARSGRAGLAGWLGLHAVLYLLLFSVAVVVSFVADGLAAEAGTGLVVSLVFALPVTIAPTVALTAIGWVIRSLPTVAFKAVVTVLVCLPLVCTSEPQQLGLLAPVQLAYGLLVRRPEWVNLVDRPDQG